MKYVKRKANNLFFTKRWPKQLQAVIGSVGFSYPLGSFTQTEAEVTGQVKLALEEYAVKVKLATNSNPEDYHQHEIDIMVEANLRRLKQTQGLPHFKVPDQHLIDYYDNDREPNTGAQDIAEFGHGVQRTAASQEFIRTKGQMASSLVPELDDVIFKEKTGQKLTMRDKVAGATWVALQTKAKKKPKMLHEQWEFYTKSKKKVISKRNWVRFCDLIQDRSLNLSEQGQRDLSKELNETLREFKNIRVAKVKVATVKRELASIRACLNWIHVEYNFDWKLKPSQLPTAEIDEVVERIPLSLAHQIQLVAYCLSPEHSHEPCATMALLYLQGGVMPTEVGRMDPLVQLENLSNVAPHVRIVGKMKTLYRKRPCPVVVGLDVVRDNIVKTIAWANVPRSTRIGQMRRFLENATGTSGLYVSHGLRHTFSQNCRHSDCRDDDKATLGGWRSYGGAGAMSMRYGRKDMFDQSNIERLYKVSLDIHRKLI